jgi:tetratricopeptide (TPR) repeat protein
MPVSPVEPASPSRGERLNASTHIDRGWSLISRGDHAAAEAELTKALQLVPNDTQALVLLGWAQMLRGAHDDALYTMSRALQHDPSLAMARVNIGYVCLKKRIYGEAIEHFTRAMGDATDRRAVLYATFYLGLLYASREMYEDAEAFFGRALALGPNLIEAYYELGRARWFSGNHAGARQAWRDGAAASKLSPWGSRCAAVLEDVEAGRAPPR